VAEPYTISQEFGPTIVAEEPPAYGYAHFHMGVDYAVLLGTPIYAGASGIVRTVGYEPGGYGHYVTVEYDRGLLALHGHLERIEVVQGQRVTQASRLGLSGSSGNSTGPHLHWGLTLASWPIPPWLLVEDRA
jgi:murein DD-endopeptidase MepM/ murein hydrolase activator NlpD